MRLGLFVDARFRRVETGAGVQVCSGTEALGFVRFAAAVGERVGTLVLIARGTEDSEAAPYELPAGVDLVPLPHYRSLRDLIGVLRALPGTLAGLWRGVSAVDAVWVSAGNPVGLILVAIAGLRRRSVVILVRQDTMSYFRSRLPSPLWSPVLVPLAMVNAAFRLLARRLQTTVVGPQLARQYGAPRDNILPIRVSLIGRNEIVSDPPTAEWPEQARLLTVGRIEPEKNPLLLPEVLAQLEARDPGRFTAIWVGEGAMREKLVARAEERGVSDLLSLPGFVPFGEQLASHYRNADILVHISLTEGLPGVLSEAMALGLPIVATDVGGVREATEDGAAALLVPPDDPGALVEAILELSRDPKLRLELIEAGLRIARNNSLESEADRIAAFISAG